MLMIRAKETHMGENNMLEEVYATSYTSASYEIIVHYVESNMGYFYVVEMIPSMCKQLHIHLTTVRGGRIDGRAFTKLAEKTMQDVKTFCTDVYNAEAMFGLKSYVKRDYMQRRLLRLHSGKNTCFYALDKNGCPKKVNERNFDWTEVRRQLTANADSKMSKKLWSATDWLFNL